MSLDYVLWRWRGAPRISRGLCYLLLAEGAEVPEVEEIDAQELGARLNASFPELVDPGAEPSFTCHLQPNGILLETWTGTPSRVLEWFEALAADEGLVLFDPQREEVTEEDLAACRSRIEAVAAEDEEERRRADFPGISSAAERGDPRALVELGNRYYFGEGVEKDDERAARLYARAAEKGDADGLFNLASCYRLGEGVEADVERAITLYERAMEQDKLFASFALGELFAGGEQVPADRERAIRYFRIAHDNGHQDAPRELRKLGALPPLPPELTGGETG